MYPVDEAVLGRIDMNVVDMPREIDVVTNGMLPISALPNAPFTSGRTALISFHWAPDRAKRWT